MITLAEYKKSLGEYAQDLTDEQIEKLMIAFDKIADLIFDSWLNKRNAA